MRKGRLPAETFDITMRPKDALQLELEEAFKPYRIASDEYFKVLLGKNNHCFRLINYSLSYCILEKEPSEATLIYFKNKHIKVFYIEKTLDLYPLIPDILKQRQAQEQWKAERNIK